MSARPSPTRHPPQARPGGPTIWLAWLAAATVGASALSGCAGLRKPTQPPSPQVPAEMPAAPASSPQASAPTLAAAPPAITATAKATQALQGQLSIKLHAFGQTPAKGLSLGFFFTGHDEAGRLDLITLMGSQLAQVDWAPGEVWLTDDKGRHRYASMAHLSTAVLGEALPLQALMHWMQGKAAPDWPSEALDHPPGFSQLGWRIDLSELDAKKLTATRPTSATQRGAFVKVYLDR